MDKSNANTSSQEPYEDSVNQEQVGGGQEPYEHSGSQEQVIGGQEPYEDRESQEPNEDSDMSSTEGSENSDLESHSDQSSEVVSSEDERESKAERECPWSPIQDEAFARLDNELQELIIKYQERGDPTSVAEAKARNILLPHYSKELRKILMKKLEWMHGMKKDPIYRRIMQTGNELIDIGEYDRREATETAIHARKFLLNRLFLEDDIPQNDNENNRTGLANKTQGRGRHYNPRTVPLVNIGMTY